MNTRSPLLFAAVQRGAMPRAFDGSSSAKDPIVLPGFHQRAMRPDGGAR